jgi:hypothetical protein
MSKGELVTSWLQRNGVPNGAWLGRGGNEIASFGR